MDNLKMQQEKKDLQTDVTPHPDNTITSKAGVNTDAKHVVLTISKHTNGVPTKETY